MKFNENLAVIHAYLCADGYVIRNPKGQNHNYYQIGFRNTNMVLLNDFQEKFEKVFRIKPHLIEGQRCRIGSKEIYEKLINEFGSFYSWEWKMPKLSRNLTSIWLRAYFDCEAWVTCQSHKNRMIGIDCVNKKGIRQIKRALKTLGINSKFRKRNTRNIFSSFIFGRENLERFAKEIGFLHPDKKERLNRVLNDFVNYEWLFPNEEKKIKKFIEEKIKIKGKIKKDSGILRIISKKEENLLRFQKEINKLFGIESKVRRNINGIGTIYFELSINKKEEIKKLINLGLLNKKETKKCQSLKKYQITNGK